MSEGLADRISSVSAIILCVLVLTKLEIKNKSHSYDTGRNPSNYHHGNEGTDVNLRVWPSFIVKASTGVRGTIALHAASVTTIQSFLHACVTVVSLVIDLKLINPNFKPRFFCQSLIFWELVATSVWSSYEWTQVFIITPSSFLLGHEIVICDLIFWSKRPRIFRVIMS
jgi:hypothetical protein